MVGKREGFHRLGPRRQVLQARDCRMHISMGWKRAIGRSLLCCVHGCHEGTIIVLCESGIRYRQSRQECYRCQPRNQSDTSELYPNSPSCAIRKSPRRVRMKNTNVGRHTRLGGTRHVCVTPRNLANGTASPLHSKAWFRFV